MAEALIFHYREAENFLVRMNPNAKLLALLAYSVLVSSAQPLAVFLLFLFAVVISITIKLPIKEYIKEGIFLVVLAAVMFAVSFISSGECIPAAAGAASFLSVVLASIILTDTTMPDGLSRSLGSALSHIFGKNAYVLASIIEITLSMIPMIIDSARGMLEARKARGESFRAHPFRSVSGLAASILSDLLDKAEVYTDALMSRGYDASARRVSPAYRRNDWIIIAACAAILAGMLIRRILR